MAGSAGGRGRALFVVPWLSDTAFQIPETAKGTGFSPQPSSEESST